MKAFVELSKDGFEFLEINSQENNSRDNDHQYRATSPRWLKLTVRNGRGIMPWMIYHLHWLLTFVHDFALARRAGKRVRISSTPIFLVLVSNYVAFNMLLTKVESDVLNLDNKSNRNKIDNRRSLITLLFKQLGTKCWSIITWRSLTLWGREMRE